MEKAHMIQDEIPAIRVRPTRRRGQFVGASRYVRRRKSSSTLIIAWIFGGVVGCIAGYLVLLYGFEKDPAGLAKYLPAVKVEWPAKP